MENLNFITALTGSKCLVLVLQKEVASKLGIKDRDILEYKVRKEQLIIKKLEDYNFTTPDATDNTTLEPKSRQRKNISEVFIPDENIDI